jgi:hypothetical protein
MKMNRRTVAVLLAAALGVVPLAEAGANVAGPTQAESGKILVPTPHPQDPSICFQGVARRINMLSQGVVSGPAGSIFEVDKATWNGKFKLTSNAGDVDIYFFDNFGDSIPDDPALNSPVITTQYQERGPDGETGTIPPNSNKAIVCLYEGVNVDWEYEANAPAKAKKKKRK